MILFKRVLKAGLINFKRQGLISWAAILIVTITLSVITTIMLSQAVLNYSLNQVRDKVDVTVYFNVGADQEKIITLKSAIENLPETKSVSYTSADEALKIFRDRHQEDYPTIQALDEINSNPLGGYLNIKAKEVSQYDAIANFLKSDSLLASGSSSIIDKVNYNQNKVVIDRLNSIIAGAQKLGFLVTLILVIISILITFNTIRLTIFISKEEIGVMRLVGASKTRVRGPFMIEGAIYGFLATVITMLIFWPTTAWLGNHMTNFFGSIFGNHFKFLGNKQVLE